MDIWGISIDQNHLGGLIWFALVVFVVEKLGGLVLKLIGWLLRWLIGLLKKLSPSVANWIVQVWTKVYLVTTSPLARFIFLSLTIGLLLMLSNSNLRYAVAVASILICWSMYRDNSKQRSSSDKIFSDTFSDLKAWETVKGNPKLDHNFGNPSPSVFFPLIAGTKDNSVIRNKKVQFVNGIVEADVYLKPNSLLNLVFRADFASNKYYMARIDSRPGNVDAILRNDGNGWSAIVWSNHNSTADVWHRMKLVVSGDKIELHNENGPVVTAVDATYKKGDLGFFNEVGEVYVDNVSIGN